MKHTNTTKLPGRKRPVNRRKATAVSRPRKAAEAFTVLADADDDRPRWLEARQGLVTASDIPAILGIVPGRTRLWYEKAGLLAARSLEEFEAVGIGRELEDAVAAMFATRTGRRIEREQKLCASVRYPWIGATLDYSTWLPAGERGPLELKTTAKPERWPDGEEPWEGWQAQVQTQMLVTRATFGSLAALIGAPYFHHRWVDVEADAVLQERIVTETRAFIDSIERLDPPGEEDASDDTSDALKRLALDVLGGESIVLPPDSLRWATELDAAREARLVWGKREQHFRNLLMAAIGARRVGVLPDGSGHFTLLPQHRRGYSVPDTTFRELKKVLLEG